MKKLILSLALISLHSVQAYAESCVWKAEKDGSTIYLGGTFHLLRASDFPLPPEFDTAYAASDLLVFEVDMDLLNSVETQQKIMAAAMYSDGTTLADHISHETFKLLSDHCAEKGLPIAMVQQMKPSMATVTLLALELVEMGIAQQGADVVLHQKAVADSKPIEWLETIDWQIEMLLSMGADNPDEFITYSLEDLKAVKRDFPFMINAWKIGDTSGLEHFTIEELKEHPEIYEQLLVSRNNAWIEKIPSFQQTPQVEFILVGAAHLIGPDGVLAALKKDGWQITQLSTPPAE